MRGNGGDNEGTTTTAELRNAVNHAPTAKEVDANACHFGARPVNKRRLTVRVSARRSRE
jgi:hypothetical protein